MHESRFQNRSCGLPGENISALVLHFHCSKYFFETKDVHRESWVAAVAQISAFRLKVHVLCEVGVLQNSSSVLQWLCEM